MNKKTSIVDYYRARASEYEQIYYRKVPERRREIADCRTYLEKLAKGKSVLDLACGTGYWTKVLAESAGEVLASDIAIEMIRQAKLKDYRSHVDFVAGDLYHPPFPEGAFDLIVIGFWFSHEPKQNYEKFFDAISYPLSSSGQIWMIDNNPPAEGPQCDSAGKDQYNNNFKKRKLDNGNEFTVLKNYFTEHDLRSTFRDRFEIREISHKKYYWSLLLGNQGGSI